MKRGTEGFDIFIVVFIFLCLTLLGYVIYFLT
jgi:hypothetical protein